MMYFEKYHGTGNDFVILNGLESPFDNPSQLAKKLCDRHFGVGADGMIIAVKDAAGDFFMKFYNADGSVAPMCGNGIRCYAKYLYDHGLVQSKTVNIATLAGLMKIELDPEVKSATVNMGSPVWDLKNMNVKLPGDTFINQSLSFGNREFQLTVLTMGTLHAVIFVDDLDCVNVGEIGSLIESSEYFPERINVNFCEVIDSGHIKVATYERGVGPTLSCGTGSSAAAVVSQLVKACHSEVSVFVPGGKLVIEQKHSEVYLKGPAEKVFTGYYNEVGK